MPEMGLKALGRTPVGQQRQPEKCRLFACKSRVGSRLYGSQNINIKRDRGNATYIQILIFNYYRTTVLPCTFKTYFPGVFRLYHLRTIRSTESRAYG